MKPRTIPSKVPYIQDLLREKDQLFIALTETWLAEHIDAEMAVEGYTLFRKDRERRRCGNSRDSGGVAVYLRNDIAASTETILGYSNGVTEITGLYSKAKNLILIVVYRQPDSTVGKHRSTSKEFKQALSKLEEALSAYSPTPNILLCGDFNLPNAKWPDGQAGEKATRDERIMMEDLMELTNEFFLSQVITNPTHRSGHTLDLLFSNNEALLHNIEEIVTVVSDHVIIECTTSQIIINEEDKLQNRLEDSEIGFHNLNFFSENTDWEGIENELKNQNWESEFRASNPEQMLKKFIDICKEIVIKYTPTRRKRANSNDNGFIPRDRKKLMRKRRRITAQLKKTSSEARQKKLKEEFIQIERELIKSHQQSQERSESKAVESIKRNSKYFFSYAKKFASSKIGIGPFIDGNNELVTSSEKMADMLSTQYNSVYSIPKEPLPKAEELFTNNHVNNHWLHNINFDEEDIVEAIDQISPSAAAGPDGFPAMLLKTCKYSISKPLYLIWRRSLDSGLIPRSMKTANIIPIHKGGSRGLPSNYRPVALTSHLIKVFERVLRKYIVAYLEENDLYNPGQHGFRQGRSCLSQLIGHFDNVTRLLEEGKNVDVIYLDFAKAFDKVDFYATMKKLDNIGISGSIGKWIYSFLTNRKQTVIVDGIRGSSFDVKSGVPQGSVIGPLLFLVLISDIDKDVVSASISSFADDTRVSKGIGTADDAAALQSELQAIYRWAHMNSMEFNNPKFECLRYGRNKDIKDNTSYKASSGERIEEKENVKDLGVIMSNDGTFKQQVNSVVATGSQLCGWVLRTFRTRQRLPMLTLWKALIRPKLEYCCQLWCPVTPGDIQKIEQIQRSFISKISDVMNLSYWNQLQKLSIYSLERRRERYIIIYTWKILENLVPNTGQVNQSDIRAYWHPRRGRTCFVPRVELRGSRHFQTIREASFGIRGPRLFNALPTTVRNLTGCSVESFKRCLDKYLSTVPDEPQIRGYTSVRRAESNSLLHMVQLGEFLSNNDGRGRQNSH